MKNNRITKFIKREGNKNNINISQKKNNWEF